MVVGKEVLRAEPSSSTSSVFCCRPRELCFCLLSLFLSLSLLLSTSAAAAFLLLFDFLSRILSRELELGSVTSRNHCVAGAVVFCEGEKWQLLFLELSFVFLCFAFLWTYFSVGKGELCFSTCFLSSFWVNLLFFSDSVTFSVAPPFRLFFSLFFFLETPFYMFRQLSCILV